MPQSTAFKQAESSKCQDDILRNLLDRLNSIVAQKTPFKKGSLPSGIANQLYNILIKENSDNWTLDKKSTRKRLTQLYKERVITLERDAPVSPTLRISKKNTREELFTLTPRRLFQDFARETHHSKEDRVPLGSLLSPEIKSDSDDFQVSNSLMKTYTKVMKKLSDKPVLDLRPTTTRKTRSQTKL